MKNKELKRQNTIVEFTGFTSEEAKHFNQMNVQCKRKNITVPDVNKGTVRTTLKQAFDWLLHQGILSGGKDQFKVYIIFNNAYNTVKWEQKSNYIKIKRYK